MCESKFNKEPSWLEIAKTSLLLQTNFILPALTGDQIMLELSLGNCFLYFDR